ncbi:MAG TPA: PEP/pyruvate-binding domain-containing protein [Vicinamibacteria bacterium]|nr:PEP/pyruvate-binding domain-containing protein [Vicinamibacteria bacterium]
MTEGEAARPSFLRETRFQDFHDLMRYRVMEILLVASPYDSFILEEAGQLSERVLGEFRNLDLHYGPGLTGVSTGAEALELARGQRRFDLIVTAPRLADMTGPELALRVRQAGLDVPVLLLAFDAQELKEIVARSDLSGVERAFLWQGDARILLAMVKCVEDRRNVDHDTRAVGVQVIILIEDNVRYYSSFLPTIYAELLHHSQRLLAEGVNLAQKIMRMRARPKILLCGTYEEAWQAFTRYQEDILGVVSDVEFPRDGSWSAEAGLEFARRVKVLWPDVPVLLQSSRPENEPLARAAGAEFLLKGSPLLLNDLRRFMLGNFGFGDFQFRHPDGTAVTRVTDLRSLEEALHRVPAESLAYHAERNHFSKWLKARTEFALAHALRPARVSDFATVEDLRRTLIRAIADYRRERDQAVVADFDRDTFDASADMYRIGGGSLGGKARGLAFVRRLLSESGLSRAFAGVALRVPPAIVLATDVFDRFLDQNELRDFAVAAGDDAELLARFLAAEFPDDAKRDLAAYLDRVRHPLAVRSSSILEDSQHQPFTGVYQTYMLPNSNPSREVRLELLVRAVKRVFASTFTQQAKAYIRATPYRLEEERMAVIVQRVVGADHGGRFYPDFAGVARSWNFYPTPPLEAKDGIAAVGLGLGRTVVEGSNCLRFCPRHPRHLIQFSSVEDLLRNSQRSFWAVDLARHELGDDTDTGETPFGLDAAEADGTLAALASTHSAENDAVYDGVSRAGQRLVSFAPILKHGLFPLAEILDRLLGIGGWGMGAPVEIEFAVDLSGPSGRPKEFAVLQLRPLALARETEELVIGHAEPERILCRSGRVLGNGRIEDIRDVIMVEQRRFDRARSRQTALELGRFNAELAAQGLPYLLIGVGRWGSADPWLGIPVSWDQISGARVIVEAGLADIQVTPSQGTHFFQNITSFDVGYFTINPDAGDGFVDWEWLAAQPALSETSCVRHLRLERPLVVEMNGRRNEGVVLKA